MSNYDGFLVKLNKIKSEISRKCLIYKSIADEIGNLKLSNLSEESQIEWSSFVKSLNKSEIRILFCGLVKAGKSSCINEFFENKLNLPAEDTPTTHFCTVVSYSLTPQLYSEEDGTHITDYEFNGYQVPKSAVGKTRISNSETENYNMIYYVKIKDEFLINNLVIIDSPGSNETDELSKAIIKNLTRLNPQIMIYIFDCGPGFIAPDVIFWNSIQSNVRKDLKKVFIFNKFDSVFTEEKIFNHSNEEDDDDDYESTDDSEDSDDSELNGDLERAHKKHLLILKEYMNDPVINLLGYSSSVLKRFRMEKLTGNMFLARKHLDLHKLICHEINQINIETICKSQIWISDCLFSEFKFIFDGILRTQGKFIKQTQMTKVVRGDLMTKFDKSHSIDSIQKLYQLQNVDFYNVIKEIIQNHDRSVSYNDSDQIVTVVKALGRFFTDRYVTIFSNMLNTLVQEMNFDFLRDTIKLHNIDVVFAHSTCILKRHSQESKLEQVIKDYFLTEISAFLDNYVYNVSENRYDLNTPEGQLQSIRSHFNYKIDSIKPYICAYMNKMIEAEKSQLNEAINRKTQEINADFVMDQTETDKKIQNLIPLVRTWLKFISHRFRAIYDLKNHSKEKRKFYNSIINNSEEEYRTEKLENGTQIVFLKTETIVLEEISCKSNELVRFFLRTKYISGQIISTNFYFRDEVQQLCFVTEIVDDKYQQMWKVLSLLLWSDRKKIVLFLINTVLILLEKWNPIQNFSPDMVFVKLLPNETSGSPGLSELKLCESVAKFNDWIFTKDDGERAENIFFKYPRENNQQSVTESMVSMMYAVTWSILIVCCGHCCDLIDGQAMLLSNNCINLKYRTQLSKRFATLESCTLEISSRCSKILEYCIIKPIHDSLLLELLKKFEELKQLCQ